MPIVELVYISAIKDNLLKFQYEVDKMTTLRRDKNSNAIQCGTEFTCVNQALTTDASTITVPANALQVVITGGIAGAGFYYSHNGTAWNYATNATLEIAKMTAFYLKGATAMTAELTYNIANY